MHDGGPGARRGAQIPARLANWLHLSPQTRALNRSLDAPQHALGRDGLLFRT
jgi:hypothetical protein